MGAGRAAYYAAFYTAALGEVREIVFCDLDPQRSRQTAELLARQFPAIRCAAANSFQEVPHADVAVLATTSTQPLLRPPGLGANLVLSLGADTDYQRELDPAWAAADIFVDTLDCARFGDLRAWLAAGLIRSEQLVDFFTLLRDGAPGASASPRIFVSTGSALFDNLTISYLLRGAAATS